MTATLSTVALGLSDLAEAVAGKPAKPMPSIFVAHGSPMNAIEDNDFTRTLQRWGYKSAVLQPFWSSLPIG